MTTTQTANPDTLIALAESLAWAGVVVTNEGDYGTYIDVPCAYGRDFHLSINVTWNRCEVRNFTTGETFRASCESCENAITVAVRNIVHQRTMALGRAA